MFERDGQLYRAVSPSGMSDYRMLMESGLYEALQKERLLVSHEEVSADNTEDDDIATVLRPDRVPFFSYPYEWCFSQLQDAALLTLRVLRLAMDHGMTLKDATAFNVSFIGCRPVFVDTLSFTAYEEGAPWAGYRQFCEFFLAPLLLMKYRGMPAQQLLRVWSSGVPLPVAVRLLPVSARMKPGALMHVFMHARAMRDSAAAPPERRRSQPKRNTLALIENLETTVRSLRMPKRRTEWTEYYDDTVYDEHAFAIKRDTVAEWTKRLSPASVWDFGSNAGLVSERDPASGSYTMCFEKDERVVDAAYRAHRDHASTGFAVMDLVNPSPSLGWAHAERDSLAHRGPADLVLYLALLHHIALHGGIPFARQAAYLAQVTKHCIVEWVPPGDPNIPRMVSAIAGLPPWYTHEHFLRAFSEKFSIERELEVGSSRRRLYLLGKHHSSL